MASAGEDLSRRDKVDLFLIVIFPSLVKKAHTELELECR